MFMKKYISIPFGILFYGAMITLTIIFAVISGKSGYFFLDSTYKYAIYACAAFFSLATLGYYIDMCLGGGHRVLTIISNVLIFVCVFVSYIMCAGYDNTTNDTLTIMDTSKFAPLTGCCIFLILSMIFIPSLVSHSNFSIIRLLSIPVLFVLGMLSGRFLNCWLSPTYSGLLMWGIVFILGAYYIFVECLPFFIEIIFVGGGLVITFIVNFLVGGFTDWNRLTESYYLLLTAVKIYPFIGIIFSGLVLVILSLFLKRNKSNFAMNLAPVVAFLGTILLLKMWYWILITFLAFIVIVVFTSVIFGAISTAVKGVKIDKSLRTADSVTIRHWIENNAYRYSDYGNMFESYGRLCLGFNSPTVDKSFEKDIMQQIVDDFESDTGYSCPISFY